MCIFLDFIYSYRVDQSNIILAGFLFLKPVVQALVKLYNTGNNYNANMFCIYILTLTGVHVSVHGHTYTSRCALIGMSTDLPARAMVLNFVQFNGYWGCPHCLQRGD